MLSGSRSGRTAGWSATMTAPSVGTPPSTTRCTTSRCLPGSPLRSATAPFKAWDLPPAMTPIRHRLERVPGGDRQMVKILAARLIDGIDAVETACAEALGQGVHSADVVLNILARHREPEPPVPIATPKALRLVPSRSPTAPDMTA